MNQVNILDAKTNLSKLIVALESKEYDFITIARNGKPVAKLTLFENEAKQRIGVAKGKFDYKNIDDFDWCNDEIAEEFARGVL